MHYKHTENAGYYGSGGWSVYSFDCKGYKTVHAVLGSERDAIDYCRWGSNYKAFQKAGK